MIITAATPQPSRLSTNPVRNSFEAEIWDDNSDVIFAAKDVTLTIPMRVNGRIWITGQGDLAGAGVLTVNVDSAAQTPATTVGGAVTASITTYADLAPGNHTITITSGVAITNPLIMVRRGRVPPTI